MPGMRVVAGMTARRADALLVYAPGMTGKQPSVISDIASSLPRQGGSSRQAGLRKDKHSCAPPQSVVTPGLVGYDCAPIKQRPLLIQPDDQKTFKG